MKLTDIVHRWQETHVLHLPSFLQGKGSHGKPNLSTDSISLARNRIQTSKCTRENSGLSGGSEELHVVLPRQDSITLAKRRLSHDVQPQTAAAANAAAAAPADAPASPTRSTDSSSSWHIPSQ